ncbi:GNAT family N-acetyltransferase [Leptospira ilyithenensis]|uniref:GNAT family N-acetyltransferase n=1 Tax=Leptospira ilyithenensis TaxID=2484901 RepID=A0A4R9LN64_9LEPT|nr:GNAT family N-acetyltransferase [Leptospira ilyithenensis]TGN08434.1 GNAT family N-acetyltransferase [Leptospira ilyithenensis]
MTKTFTNIVCETSFLSFTKEEWNRLVPEDSMFQEWEFLSTLESSGCIGRSGDWDIRILSYREAGVLRGVLPFYKRKDSYGEYIFDFQWADAFHRAGIPYYPKYSSAVPFTPVTGSRILISPDISEEGKVTEIQKSLLDALVSKGEEECVSSVHVLFCKEEELKSGKLSGFVPRVTHQYHWFNKDFQSFEDYLGTLVKDRRKTIKQERKKIAALPIRIETLVGDAIGKEHADIFYSFYQDTHSRKWGQAYLNHQFFRTIFDVMKHRIHLVLASDESGKPIGGSFNFYRGDYLFGRYWGATSHVPNLHFECCYYQLIEFAIRNKMKRVEAGAQGEHKFLRGYEAVPMYSMHYIYNESGRQAIYHYLEKEILMEEANIKEYNHHSPIKSLRNGDGNDN